MAARSSALRAQGAKAFCHLAEASYNDSEGLLLLRDHRGAFYTWNGLCWTEIDRRDVRRDAYQWLEHATYIHPKDGEVGFNPTRRKIDDVVDALRAIVMLDSSVAAPCWTQGATDPPANEVISMENGLLHVPTRTLHPHTPHFFCHHSLPFPFSEAWTPPPRWLEFLHELWADDESSISALQETMGYILGGDTRHQKIFLFVGPKRGGKGTIGRVLTGLLGEQCRLDRGGSRAATHIIPRKSANGAKRSIGGVWRTAGHRNDGSSRRRQSDGGDRGNTRQAHERLRARNGQRETQTRAVTGVGSASSSRRRDRCSASSERCSARFELGQLDWFGFPSCVRLSPAATRDDGLGEEWEI